jgi:hypothetical protein
MNVRSTRRLIAVPLIGLALLALAACGSNSPSVAHLSAKRPSQSSSSSPGSTSSLAGSPSGGSPASGAHAQASIRMIGLSGANAVKFSACIRAHGVPNFPDPNAEGVFSLSSSDASLPQSSQFQTASKACRSLLHLGGGSPTAAESAKILAQLLKYSECMRSHDITNFPDPTDSGGRVALRVKLSGSINPQSPIFQRAQSACASLQPGGAAGGPLP